jgi:ABC-type glycerol-3-phosphate transport system substrate-binding protein
MKKLMASLIFVVVSSTMVLAQTTKPTAKKSSLRHWVLNITPDSKKTYLDSVVAAWKKDNIDLKFSTLNYDASGKLIKFKGSVEIKVRDDKASGTFDDEEFKSVRVEVDDGPGVDIKGK